MASDTGPDQEEEAKRQIAIAVSKFESSDLNAALKHARKAHRLFPNTDGVSSMVSALEILHAASVAAVGDAPDWYKVLQVEPFSHINTIKKQYRKLALVLHPDKNSFSGCEEAFKLVNEGFMVFSDRIRRKEYDIKLRIKIQDENVGYFGAEDANDNDDGTTFSTACPHCQLLHKMKRTYLGHDLMCPNCRETFEATEVGAKNVDDDKNRDGIPLVNENSKGEIPVIKTYIRRKRGGGGVDGVSSNVHLSCASPKRKIENCEDTMCKSKEKESEDEDETMTLARMQLKIKKKVNTGKAKSKIGERMESQEKNKVKSNGEGPETKGDNVLRGSGDTETEADGQQEASKKRKKKDIAEVKVPDDISRGTHKRNRSSKLPKKDRKYSLVDDLDLYYFDKDRTEKAFKKGKIWAIYDDTDGIPRNYGLVDEIVSLNPFKVNISWLDFQDDWKHKLISYGRTESQVTCGKFRVSKRTLIKQLNIFSHVMDSERAAREIYLIYPKKGSVWAVHTETDPGSKAKNRNYEIVVCLTSYSDIYGLSVAYLEKIDELKTFYKRRGIGLEAVNLMEKNDVFRVLSHQIPARKLSEDHHLSKVWKECWELDPASVPTYDE